MRAHLCCKDAIITAAAEHGRDGSGKGGLVGYCRLLAKDQPRAFAQLLGRILPMQVTEANEAPTTVTLVRYSDLEGDHLSCPKHGPADLLQWEGAFTSEPVELQGPDLRLSPFGGRRAT